MISEANENQKKEIYDLWNKTYPKQEKELRDYFENQYMNDICLIVEQDDKIISTLTMEQRILSFKDMQFNVSYFDHIVSASDYRMRGHMRSLMEDALTQAKHNHLFSFVYANNPRIYEKFHFQNIYETKRYCIYRNALEGIDDRCVTTSVTALELLKAYKTFTSHFDGYFIRDVTYYEHLKQQIRNGIYGLVAYRNREGIVSGYLIYRMVKSELHIVEAIYQNALSLQRMLKRLMRKRPMVILDVSKYEQLEKIFPLSAGKKNMYMMVRLNHPDLFEKLFHVKAKNAIEAYDVLQKALWIKK